jgi:NAD(P)-dependent dehydrogenase (short-subunit alcohol dehydrogenase family)
MSKPFAGRRAVVTGGGRDFGRAVSIWLAREGATVDLCARKLDDAHRTAEAIRAEGHSARAYACDLTDAESIHAFAAALAKDPTPPDTLMLNAAQWLEGELDGEVGDDDIVSTIASGLTGSILLTKALLPALSTEPGADIVAMVSVCGRPGFTASEAHPAFYAAKHGLSGFTQILRARLQSQGTRVIAAYPPDFATPDPLANDDPVEAHAGLLNGKSVWEGIRYALLQPRTCCVSTLHFDGPSRQDLQP